MVVFSSHRAKQAGSRQSCRAVGRTACPAV